MFDAPFSALKDVLACYVIQPKQESIQLLHFQMQVIFSAFCLPKSFNGRYLFLEDHSCSMLRTWETVHFLQKIISGAAFRCSLSLQFHSHWYFSVIDGGWSTWSTWRSCSENCGGGFQMRTRSCDAPKPKYGGARCRGNYFQTISCNTENCPGNDVLFFCLKWAVQIFSTGVNYP